MKPLDILLSKLGQAKKQGRGYLCHCPAHEDKKSSLSVTETQDGGVLLKCHAGCETEKVLGAVGLTFKDLYPDNSNNHTREITETYDYKDETAKLLYQVVRYSNKDFNHRRLDGLGEWIWNMKGVRRVPYNLPAVIKAIKSGQPVYIVEGEKDADRLISLGLMATTNSGGALKWPSNISNYFENAKVVILPDNDKPGQEHALSVANSLYDKAAAIKIVNLPGLKVKHDVSDWLGAGNNKADLIKFVKQAKLWQPQEQNNIGILMSDVQSENVHWLWPDYIPLGKLTIIDGDPGQGKSTLSLDLAARLSTGKNMPGCTGPRGAVGVVILSAEDGLADTIKPRLIAAGADCSRILALTTTTDTETGEERPFVLPDDLDLIRKAINRVDAKLLIIDPFMAFLSGNVNSHRDQDIRRVLHVLANLAEEAGITAIVIRHLNKTNTSNALYRGGGSIGIIGAARSGLLVASDPDDENKRVLASVKCNLAKKPESLSFHLEACNGVSKIVWDGVSSHNANTLLVSNEEQGAIEEAENVLREILANGAVLANDVKRDAKEAGVSERTLYRAKAKLKVQSFKEGLKAWYWELPKMSKPLNGNLGNVGNLHKQAGEKLKEPSEDCQSSINDTFDNLQGADQEPTLWEDII